MNPVNIPSQLRHESEGFRTITLGAPPGTESEIASVEAEVGDSRFGPTMLILMKASKKDLATLNDNGGLYWYAVMGDHLHPFSMIPIPPAESALINQDSLETHIFTDQEQNIHTPEDIAQAFHEAYERLAPEFGYETRKESAKPWAEVPEQNKQLMVAVIKDLFF